ncbi:hypothetical protein MKW94_014580 [Papaver nudicaule]|uniref:Forty-two-three domain-containing protein 1 n=1 Tax=Papaver nudicaule TaxID=74823 RepID=A0AA41VBS7_PAPNU|nr:hypothetical protein [Papaver nudicaule]
MAATVVTLKPLTSEAIALTEKKMDMTLDEIIKMSKKPSVQKNHRIPNKNQKFGVRGNPMKVKQFMDSRSSVRQGALAKRRSNFQVNHFPLATEVAKKAGVAPVRNRPFNRSRQGNNWNKQRNGAPQSIQRTGGVGFLNKQQAPLQFQAKMVAQPRQRAQTLDSLFANMKEQRMRMQSQQNNTTGRRDGFVRGAPQQQRSGRGRGYYAN